MVFADMWILGQVLRQALPLCRQGRGVLVGLSCCRPALWILPKSQYDGVGGIGWCWLVVCPAVAPLDCGSSPV